jgi:hypothetical protein
MITGMPEHGNEKREKKTGNEETGIVDKVVDPRGCR